MRKLAILVACLPLFGCSGEIVAPEPVAVTQAAASSLWTRGSFFLDFYFGNPSTCVGEVLHGVGEVPYKVHEVLNGNGGYSYFFQILPVTPRGPQYSLTGVTTGTVWWYKNGLPSNESLHLGQGEVYRWKAHEMYESDEGGRLFFERVYHLTVNANGELVVERYENSGVLCGRRN